MVFPVLVWSTLIPRHIIFLLVGQSPRRSLGSVVVVIHQFQTNSMFQYLDLNDVVIPHGNISYPKDNLNCVNRDRRREAGDLPAGSMTIAPTQEPYLNLFLRRIWSEDGSLGLCRVSGADNADHVPCSRPIWRPCETKLVSK